MKASRLTMTLAIFFSLSTYAAHERSVKHSALYNSCTSVRETVAKEYKSTTGKELAPNAEEADLYEAQWNVFGICAPLTEKLNATQLIRLEELNNSCVNGEGLPIKTLGEQNWCALENMQTVLQSQNGLPL